MEWYGIVLLIFGLLVAAFGLGGMAGVRAASAKSIREHRHVIELTTGDFIELWRDGQVLLPSMVEDDLHTVALYRGVDLDYIAGRAAMHHAEHTGEPASEPLV